MCVDHITISVDHIVAGKQCRGENFRGYEGHLTNLKDPDNYDSHITKISVEILAKTVTFLFAWSSYCSCHTKV